MKRLAIGIAMLAATPLLAQVTGPQGLAEPKAPVARPAKQKKVKADRPDKALKKGKQAAPAPVATIPPPATPDNIFNIQLSSGGTVSIQLRPDMAPMAVARLKTLAARHFYDGLTFHRVIDGFMAQGGDPKGDGSGGSDLPDLKAEFNALPHVRGALAMARAGSPDSANSQFYIVTSPTLQLDGAYTVAGRVIAGMAYVDMIEKGEPPANPTRMVRVWVGPPPANPATPATAQAAAGAAAGVASTQAAQASLAADEAARAAKAGDAGTAADRAAVASTAAQGAADAASDAAEAARTARRGRRR